MKPFTLTQTHLNAFLWIIPITVWLLLYFIFTMASPKQVALIKADQSTITKIANYLDSNGIQYELAANTTIKVNEDIRDKALLSLTQDNVIGNELHFDGRK